jgi:hypothetical protein
VKRQLCGKLAAGGWYRVYHAEMIFDQTAFVHPLDQIIDGGALGLAVADRREILIDPEVTALGTSNAIELISR